MKRMCLNGWGGKLHEQLTSYIQTAQPDILCLQEVAHSSTAQKNWLTYRDGDHILPQRTNYFRDVASALPQHVAIFCPAAQGVRIYDDSAQRTISITHMHGLCDLRGKMDTPERAVQAKRLLQLSQNLSEPDSETLQLLPEAGLSELVTGRGFISTRNTYYKKPGKFADYMLISDLSAVQHFDVAYTPEVSDHCSLILQL